MECISYINYMWNCMSMYTAELSGLYCLCVHISESYKQPWFSGRLFFLSQYSFCSLCANIYRSDFRLVCRISRSAILLLSMNKKDKLLSEQSQILHHSLQMWLFVRHHHLCMFNGRCSKKLFSTPEEMTEIIENTNRL